MQRFGHLPGLSHLITKPSRLPGAHDVRWRHVPAHARAKPCAALALFLAVAAAGDVEAQAPQPPDSAFSVHGDLAYGSASLFNPVSVVLNKGFDIVQLFPGRRDIWGFPYGNGFRTFLPDVARHPLAAIKRDPGLGTWLRTEILPLSYGDARWVVNWTEHFLGGGMTSRSLADWYRRRGVPRPKVVAGAFTLVTAALNEVMEHPNVTKGTSSSVADLWVFDLGGVLLFSWDAAARFAVEKLQFADWSNMASFTVPRGELVNNGQYFVLKLPLPLEGKRLFTRFGLGVQVGVSQRLGTEHALSVALGLDTAGRRLDPITHRETITFTSMGGVYLDRNNSLLASLTVREPHEVVLNVYPGLGSKMLLRDVGFWAYAGEGHVRAGLVHRVPGFGLGTGR